MSSTEVSPRAVNVPPGSDGSNDARTEGATGAHVAVRLADGYSVVPTPTPEDPRQEDPTQEDPTQEDAERTLRVEFLSSFDADAFTAEVDELTDDPDLLREL